VDDSKDDRDAFATALSSGGRVSVGAVSASRAYELLGTNELYADGLLMDIDLSNEVPDNRSGLGLTADIRAAQHRGTTPAFPIVRFSLRAKVAENIGLDSSSDEYFDLKVDKTV
jgi:CheY-like chemotaxis protein